MAKMRESLLKKPLCGAIGMWAEKMWQDKLANFFRNVCVGL